MYMSDETSIERLRSADPTHQHQPSSDSSRHREHLLLSLATAPSRRRARHVYSVSLVAACLAFAFILSRAQGGLTLLQVNPAAPGVPAIGSSEMDPSSSSARMWAPIEFRLAPGIDASMGKMPSWRLKNADASVFRAFAARLGAQGELVEERYGPRAEDVSWRIGDLSGTATGFFSWSNSRLYESPEMIARMAVSSCSVSSESSTTPCSLPAPAVSFASPSEATARSWLEPFFGDIEFVRTYSSGWSNVYIVAYRLGDVSVPDLGLAEVSDLGVLHVSGVFTEFELMGVYPTITAAKAVVRVSSHPSPPSSLGGVVIPLCGPPPVHVQASPSTEVRPLPAATPAQPATTQLASNPDEDISIAPIACGSDAAVQPPRIIELVAVSPAYIPIYDDAGRLWVAPAWEYTDIEGATYSAVAIIAAYYKTVSGSPPPPAGEVPSTPGVQSTPSTPSVSPVAPGAAIPGFDPVRYTGAALEVAQRRAAADGFSSRIVMIDGEGQMVTDDYRLDRLNFVVVDGVVTDVSVG
jgi:hypothetical protein